MPPQVIQLLGSFGGIHLQINSTFDIKTQTQLNGYKQQLLALQVQLEQQALQVQQVQQAPQVLQAPLLDETKLLMETLIFGREEQVLQLVDILAIGGD